ncbi:hypothetical protein MKEN_00179400 [Mycena kentingensis (nom. inval.)]|nr:hypothetical protein MKEN_00179400 [Mycena kentingensis (nom. inval.)]
MAKDTTTVKKKRAAPEPKRMCTCGCMKPVTARTELNHLSGKTNPLAKANRALRRLNVLGLSPERLLHRAQRSSFLSPTRRGSSKRQHNVRMEIDEPDNPSSPLGLDAGSAPPTSDHDPFDAAQDRATHPQVHANPSLVPKYDPADLPIRTHREFLAKGAEVQNAVNATTADRLAKESGIKGIPVLSHLSSLFFPLSFPYDFMHLIYENVLKNLILLWTGDFKGLNEGTGAYKLEPTVWEAIGAATAASGSIIPSDYCSRPQNVAADRTMCSAETWSFWMLYLGPVLLQNQFRNRAYFDHFVDLVKLVNLCLQFEYSPTDINNIRAGFIAWVEKFERLYYQYNPSRLSTCPLTIHVLLHIADGIEAAGPIWAYWAFPMERYCGRLQPYIKNRRFPFASLDGQVVAFAQLELIKVMYDCEDLIRLKRAPRELPKEAFVNPAYPSCALIPPRRGPAISDTLMRQIVKCMATRFDKSVQDMRPFLASVSIEQWAKVQRLEGGDLMLASLLVPAAADRRDATHYVQYEDHNDRRRRANEELHQTTYFGQLQNIFAFKLPPSADLELENETTFFLAAIAPCRILRSHSAGLDIHYFAKYLPVEVVDITTIQCLVGRVRTLDNKEWAVIDRSGELARPYNPEDE